MFANPVNDFYMQQAQPYHRYQFQPQNPPQFVTRPVTGIEEAKAAMIEPFTTYLFLDSSNGNIYLKRMNERGLSDFLIYLQQEEAKPQDPLIAINERLTKIENVIGGLVNDKSVSNVSSNAEPSTDCTATDVAENAESKPADVSKNTVFDKWKKRN